MFGRAARISRNASAVSRSISVWAAMSPLSASTSAISRWASASSLRALAWPISLEASLRRDWASCKAVWAARSLASRTRIAEVCDDSPFDSQARSNASGLSRMALMSCMEGRRMQVERPSLRRVAGSANL